MAKIKVIEVAFYDKLEEELNILYEEGYKLIGFSAFVDGNYTKYVAIVQNIHGYGD